MAARLQLAKRRHHGRTLGLLNEGLGMLNGACYPDAVGAVNIPGARAATSYLASGMTYHRTSAISMHLASSNLD